MWHRLAVYTTRNPARISGYISALVLYFNKHYPQFPLDIIIPSVMIMIGMGEYAQRLENKKTVEALYTENDPYTPDEEIIKKIDGKV